MNYLSVSVQEAKANIELLLRKNKVPFLYGSPGIGKSAIINEIAADFGLKVIDRRVSQMDATDFNGFPNVDLKAKRAEYFPFSNDFPLEDSALPTGFHGWLIFLDELNSGDEDVLKAVYKFIQDRSVGSWKLHPNVRIICAGNLATDKAIVNDIGNANKSRMTNLVMEVNPLEYLEYARNSDIDSRIQAYLNFKPDMVFKFDPDHDDLTHPCPRQWSNLSDIISDLDTIDRKYKPSITGTVGMGAGNEFFNYLDVYHLLPDISQIIADPNKAKLPSEPSAKYAVSTMLGDHVTMGNCEKLIAYASRMSADFKLVAYQGMAHKEPKIKTTDAGAQMIAELAELL
jgi:hypothetical protein